jgi:hypothetical protein
MIVGLKKRRASKEFYELGVLNKITNKTETITHYDGKKPITRRWHTSCAFVRTFNPIQRGRRYKWVSDHICTRPYLIAKICDEMEPGKCKRDSCPYRFRCYTSK